jgi:hypothetical protein
MERLILLAVPVVLVGWHWFIHKKSSGRSRSPLWGAFTATFVATLFTVAGALGYEINHGVPFTVASAWAGRVLWAQIALGAVVGLVAVYLWRVGLRQLRNR